MLRSIRVFGSFLPVVLVLFATAAPAGENTASSTVAGFQKSLLAVMKQSGKLDLRGRYEQLMPVITRSFHVPLMVRITTGRHWNSATKAQKKMLVKGFRRMSAATLATYFDSYDGETFEVVRERAGSNTTVVVDTRIVRRAKEPVDISYVVAKDGRRWRVVDVIVGGGISELTVRRSEYARILKTGGIETLVTALDGKADRILTKTRAASN